MNKSLALILLAGLAAGAIRAADPASPPPAPPADATTPAQTAPPVVPASPPAIPVPPAAPATIPPAAFAPAVPGPAVPAPATPATVPPADNAAAPAAGDSSKGLRMNFQDASLDTVLKYLSEAAGFIIIPESPLRGKVTIVSLQPVSKEEALDLLDAELNRNGYTAIRQGRRLRIVSRDEAKTQALPVRFGAEPEAIPETDQVVTQIIPVRFVEVAQLMKDVQPLISPQTAMTADESANTIVITDTSANIHRVAEVIKAIDAGAEDSSVIKVFHLQHANAQEMADLLTSLFPDDTRSGGSSTPVAFGGFGGFRRFFGGGGGGGGGFPGGGLGGGASGASSQNQRIKKRARVLAVADARTTSVVVTASRDLIDQIGAVVNELDMDASNLKSVAVFKLENAEPQDALSVLQDIFNKNGTLNRNNQNQNNNALQSRSTQQTQQYNNNNRTGSGFGMGGGRGGMSSFGQ